MMILSGCYFYVFKARSPSNACRVICLIANRAKLQSGFVMKISACNAVSMNENEKHHFFFCLCRYMNMSLLLPLSPHLFYRRVISKCCVALINHARPHAFRCWLFSICLNIAAELESFSSLHSCGEERNNTKGATRQT